MVPATTTPTPKAAADTSGAHTAAVANAMAASTTPTSSTSPGTAAGPLNEPALTAVTAPRFDADYLDNPRPAYPPLSRKANEQGKVVLWVSVDATGAAREVAVRSSSGFERLDRAAQAAVSRWRFVPARQGQMPVAATVLVPIVFSFKD